MVIDKWKKCSERSGNVSCVVQTTVHSTLGVYDKLSPASKRCVVSLLLLLF